MSAILLIGKDWPARALIRAQLLEEGFDVEAHEALDPALASLESSEILPALVLADVSASDDPADDVEQLAAWASQLPVWIIAAPSLIRRQTLKGRGFEMILFRPVDVGELIEQIKRRLA
jgi:DNA-binding response OmpR family regulator